MSDDGVDPASNDASPGDDIPKYHLYIRASLIDNETQGACPMSQQGFMLSYILAQEKNVDFKVWTVSQVNPPADFKDKNVGRIYPFVEGISGHDNNGGSIAGVMPETSDKVEEFFDSVNRDCPHLVRPKDLKNHILGKVDSISTQFNAFMKRTKPATVLTNILQKVENHLAENGTTFLDGNMLSYTDCFFLPRLHHIVIAGKYFWDYEIPREMKNLWRYLRDAYETPAFSETLPFDDDLLKFHYVRFRDTEMAELRKKGIKGLFGVDQALKKTCSVPDDVVAMLDNVNGTNGGMDQQDEGEEEGD